MTLKRVPDGMKKAYVLCITFCLWGRIFEAKYRPFMEHWEEWIFSENLAIWNQKHEMLPVAFIALDNSLSHIAITKHEDPERKNVIRHNYESYTCFSLI